MSISIIIPALNEAQSLRTILPELVTQHGVAEVIVVDGGSSDETRDLVTSAGAQCITTARGRARQMNLGPQWPVAIS